MTMKRFERGQKIALGILVEMLGKKKADKLWGNIYWAYSDVTPKEIGKVDIEWAGLCCPMTDGCNSIIINPVHHEKADEIALTIGHELAHALQYIANKNMNHDDDIFEAFKMFFCDRLEFSLESF